MHNSTKNPTKSAPAGSYPSRRIGYARVSTDEQDLRMQIDALERSGCEVIFNDKKSGKNLKRAGWQKALMAARPGDVLVVHSLDRLSRNLRDLIDLIDMFKEREINFHSLSENIDTTTATGRLIFHINSVFAEYQRALTAERTQKGIATRKRDGTRWGARPKLTEKQTAIAVAALEARMQDPTQGRSVLQLAKRFRVDPVTVRKAVLAATDGKKLWPPGPHAAPHERSAEQKRTHHARGLKWWSRLSDGQRAGWLRTAKSQEAAWSIYQREAKRRKARRERSIETTI